MPDLSTITPVTREEEFLDRIARAAASPNLPEVDASDNGDVLTVVSGEWAAAAPAEELPEVTSSNNGQVLTVVSGEWTAAAPGLLLVNVTWNEGGTAATLNKNFNEISTALSNGVFVFGLEVTESVIECYCVGHTSVAENSYTVKMRDMGTTSVEELAFVATTPTGTLTYED